MYSSRVCTCNEAIQGNSPGLASWTSDTTTAKNEKQYTANLKNSNILM